MTFDPEKIARDLISIAMASQRPDGKDIPLGEQVRAGAAAILALSEQNAALERRVGELETQVQAFGRILPSMAGADQQPDSKVVAVYANLGELRAIRQALAFVEEGKGA